VTGLERPPGFDALDRAAAELTPEMSERCMALLVGSLARQGRIDGRIITAEIVTPPSGPDMLVLRDTAHDAWLFAAPIGVDWELVLRRALDQVTEWADIRPVCLLVDAELDRRLRDPAPR